MTHNEGVKSLADDTEPSTWATGAESSRNGTSKDGFAALAILAITAVLVIVAINAFV